MKQTTKTIIILLAVLLVLGGGVGLLLLTGQDNTAEPQPASSAESSDSAALITGREIGDVSAVAVQAAGENWTMVPDGDYFAIQGYEDIPSENASIAGVVNSLLTMGSFRNLGAKDELEAYGLAGDEAAQVEIRYQDGKKDSFTVGKVTSESGGRYVLWDGEVHLVSGISYRLFEGMCSFFRLDLYSVPDRADDEGNPPADGLTDILYHLKLSGTHFPQEVEIAYDTSVVNQYLMNAPVVAESGTELMKTILASLKAPTALSVAAAKPDDETLERYGLLEPYAVADFDLNNEKHVLTVSPLLSGNRYLMVDGGKLIYQVEDSVVSSWAEADLLKLRMSYVWLEMIQEVSQLEITDADGQSRVIRVQREEKEDGSGYDLSVFTAQGKEIPLRGYQDFYMDVVGIPVFLQQEAESIGETAAWRVEYRHFDGSAPTVVEYRPAGDQRYAAMLNGAYSGLVRQSDTDKVFAGLDELLAGAQ